MKPYRKLTRTSGGYTAYPETVTTEVKDLAERKLLSDILKELREGITLRTYTIEQDGDDPLKYNLLDSNGAVCGSVTIPPGALLDCEEFDEETYPEITNE